MRKKILIDMIKGDISENGQNNIYHITIDGYRAQDLTFDCDILKDSYNIIDIVDETLPDYDFRILYQENIDNIIGMYISKINGMDIQEGLKKKGGYCPCRFEKNEDTKCMCKEFRDQIKDPNFEGYCHCLLYYKSVEE